MIVDKLKDSINEFQQHSNINPLKSVLEELIDQPGLLKSGNKESFTILINLLNIRDEKNANYVKISILDIFMSSMEFDDLAVYWINQVGLIAVLFDNFYDQSDFTVKMKILKCLELYLLHEYFDRKVLLQCEEFCCENNSAIMETRIQSACQSIVRALLRLEGTHSDSDGSERLLVTLSVIYRRYGVALSPDSCGDINTFKSFKQLLIKVCESEKYSSISAVCALSCFYRCSDDTAVKCFTVKNADCIIRIIYDSLTDSGSSTQATVYAALLLTDVLQKPDIIVAIRRGWSTKEYKSICKLLIYEFPSAHYEKLLELFCLVKQMDLIEWTIVIENYLTSNSKFFSFINGLTVNESSDRCAILGWRLLQLYFQPMKIAESFSREYCNLISGSVKANLVLVRPLGHSKGGSPSNCQTHLSHNNSNLSTPDTSLDSLDQLFIDRARLRQMSRALASIHTLLTVTKCDEFSAHVASINGVLQLSALCESLVRDLILEIDNCRDSRSEDNSQSGDVAGVRDGGIICLTQALTEVRAALVVSLVYFPIHLSANYPSLVCRKYFNSLLTQTPFMKTLARCLCQTYSQLIVERSVALTTVSCQFADYNLTLLSELIMENLNVIRKKRQSHLKLVNQSSPQYCSPMVDELSIKYQASVRRLVDSWMTDPNNNFSSSDIMMIFTEEIRSLRESQNSLESAIKEKDEYIRQCHSLSNDYRLQSIEKDNRFLKLANNYSELEKIRENHLKLITNFTEKIEKNEKDIENKENMISLKNEEIDKQKEKLTEFEKKYKKISEKLEQSEEFNDNLRKLLAKSQEEQKEKEKEINRLQHITKVINDLIGNKINPESFSLSGDGS